MGSNGIESSHACCISIDLAPFFWLIGRELHLQIYAKWVEKICNNVQVCKGMVCAQSVHRQVSLNHWAAVPLFRPNVNLRLLQKIEDSWTKHNCISYLKGRDDLRCICARRRFQQQLQVWLTLRKHHALCAERDGYIQNALQICYYKYFQAEILCLRGMNIGFMWIHLVPLLRVASCCFEQGAGGCGQVHTLLGSALSTAELLSFEWT